MIGNLEGALSSRRKGAEPIIRAGGEKSRKIVGREKEKCRLYFKSRKGGK
jgi:hypothetical protein